MDMKEKTSFALTEEAIKLLAALAKRNGVSRSAMIEFIIRETARREAVNAAQS